ncbi:MAG: FtsX-like permease family protein [Proteobacteria bacterium]|nr:FtsX-like permease family protein [Pseudomonadota bacterium]MBI3499251.1 FtsX-like permease family protein [Pseudomonadota bacterium]
MGSLSAALVNAVESQTRVLLGGDVGIHLVQRPASETELAWLRQKGRLSSMIALMSMAEKNGGGRALAEIWAVDQTYPLLGGLELEPASPLAPALALADGSWGVAVEPALQARLGLKLGDRLKIGETSYQVRAIIRHQPDWRVFLTWGRPILVAEASLRSTQLLRPDSLIHYFYRLVFADAITPAAFGTAAKDAFPDAGWRLYRYDELITQARQPMQRMGQLLTLVGLSTLIIGGVGIAAAVRSHLESKVTTIATLKCLGASAGLVLRVNLALVLAMATAGIAIGVMLGALAPIAAAQPFASMLPLKPEPGLHWQPLLLASACGALTTFAFALWPLAEATSVRPASLFRAVVAPPRHRSRWGYLAVSTAALAALACIVVWSAGDRKLALYFIAAAVGVVVTLGAAARGLMAVARRIVRTHNPMLRLAFANLHRPGAPTGSVTVSLGLGLTVLVAVSSVETNLLGQIRERIPEHMPSFYFYDIHADQVAEFDRTVREVEGAAILERPPWLWARLIRIAGVPIADAPFKAEGDKKAPDMVGVSYAAVAPMGARLAQGEWWDTANQTSPLVSVDDAIARGFGLALGDTMTFSILGREIEARIANTRSIDWDRSDANFAFIFSPGLLEGVPHTYVAAVSAESEAVEGQLLRALADRLPEVPTVRVRDVLGAQYRLLESIDVAVRIAAAMMLLAGTLVLAGAIMTGRKARVRDAVVLKILGVRPREVVASALLEYGCIGLLAASIGAALGTAAGYFVVTRLMHGEFVFTPSAVASTVLFALAITLSLGVAGTWHALSQKAAPMLRNG